MSKKVTLNKPAMDAMIRGLDKVAEAVSGTIGPCGRNVYLKDSEIPKITNDGFTIATRISLSDPEEDAGAYVIRNVAGQQNDDVGDGTTTVSVLTQALIHECLKRPENAMQIKASLKAEGDKILQALAKKSIPLRESDIEKIALISSEDKNVAHLISEIVKKLGNKAVVNVEDSKTFSTDYEIVDGYEANVGFMSPHFVTDKKSGKAIYTDVPVLVVDKKIASLADIKPIFDVFKAEGINSCVIVCEDADDSILGLLVANKQMGTFNSLVIRATGWLLQDIEGATGATAISPARGITPEKFKKEHLGFAKKVVCNANTTLFTVDGKAAKTYSNILHSQAENDPNQFSSKQLMRRVDKLRGGVAILRIGASTDFERDYLRLKAEDSVKAVQAALAEGYVEGGGMTLWRIAQSIEPKSVGAEILKKAMTAPLRKIIENAGQDYTEVISALPSKLGYNAKENRYENLIEAGIIDPTKVERCALENAISATSVFVTTFCLITEVSDEKAS